jgi:uncharacterized protein (TIRG00374 family)
MKNILEKLKTPSKITLGIILIVYVLHSKMIDFEALGNILTEPKYLFGSLFLILTTSFLCTFRWHLLMQAQNLSVSLFDTFQLTMIGVFFNTFLPGAVGGDLVKAWYIAGREPEKRTRAVFTVFADRLLGLFVFFLFAAGSLIFFSFQAGERPELYWLARSIWTACGICLFFIFLYFISHHSRSAKKETLKRKLESIPIVKKLLEAVLAYRYEYKKILLGTLFSTLSILITILLYFFLGKALGIELGFLQYCFVVPIALVISAVPLLPGGIGVGQVAFFTLFQWAGSSQPEQGATLCTIYQTYTILFNCMGAFFYLKFRNNRPSYSSTTLQSTTL